MASINPWISGFDRGVSFFHQRQAQAAQDAARELQEKNLKTQIEARTAEEARKREDTERGVAFQSFLEIGDEQGAQRFDPFRYASLQQQRAKAEKDRFAAISQQQKMQSAEQEQALDRRKRTLNEINIRYAPRIAQARRIGDFGAVDKLVKEMESATFDPQRGTGRFDPEIVDQVKQQAYPVEEGPPTDFADTQQDLFAQQRSLEDPTKPTSAAIKTMERFGLTSVADIFSDPEAQAYYDQQNQRAPLVVVNEGKSDGAAFDAPTTRKIQDEFLTADQSIKRMDAFAKIAKPGMFTFREAGKSAIGGFLERAEITDAFSKDVAETNTFKSDFGLFLQEFIQGMSGATVTDAERALYQKIIGSIDSMSWSEFQAAQAGIQRAYRRARALSARRLDAKAITAEELDAAIAAEDGSAPVDPQASAPSPAAAPPDYSAAQARARELLAR